MQQKQMLKILMDVYNMDVYNKLIAKVDNYNTSGFVLKSMIQINQN